MNPHPEYPLDPSPTAEPVGGEVAFSNAMTRLLVRRDEEVASTAQLDAMFDVNLLDVSAPLNRAQRRAKKYGRPK